MPLLALDYGTTALKAVLFSDGFEILAQAQREWIYTYPADGQIECPVEAYWVKTTEAVRELFERAPEFVPDAISVTGQSETMILLDDCSAPLGNAIVWLDTRAQAECEAFSNRYRPDHLYRATGNTGFDPIMPLFKFPWLMRNEPERYARMAKMLLLKEYIVYRLTGRMCAEGTAESCSGYYDIERGSWDDVLLAQAGIDRARLPDPADSLDIAGSLVVGREWGLPDGIPVVNGLLDQCASFLGAGGAQDGLVTETTGTVLAVAASLTSFDREAERMLTFRHALPGQFLALPNCPTAGVLLKWYRDEFAQPGSDYDAITDEIERRGRAESGLILLPHFAGYLSPVNNPDARGVLYGLRLNTARCDVAHAILEGVAFLLRENLELLARRGIRPDALVSLGGGAKSPLWLRVKANTCQLPIETLEQDEATALGCAFCAALAIGLLKEPADTLPYARRRRVVEPDAAGRAIYQEKYQLYLELNRKLGFTQNPAIQEDARGTGSHAKERI